jgi:hypothetical protein
MPIFGFITLLESSWRRFHHLRERPVLRLPSPAVSASPGRENGF